MIAIKDKFNLFYLKAKKWIQKSPDDVLVALVLSLLVMLVAVTFAFISIFKSNELFGELPTPTHVTTNNGWKFISRNAMGHDYCDLYQKGMSYQVKCFSKNEKGRWYLKNVF